MSTTQNTTDEIDEKAQQIAEAMDMTAAEFDARLYKTLAEQYADDVAESDGEQAVAENRKKTIEGMHDEATGEAAASVADGDGEELTGDAVDAYASGLEDQRRTSTSEIDETDPENYGTGESY